MKAVMVCAAGMNRSHALVLNSKEMWGWDSLPVGVWGNPSVFPVLAPWADRIVLVERWWPEHFIPSAYLNKVVWLETGVDIWGSPKHPELYALAHTLLKHWEKTNFKAGILITKSGQIEEVKDNRPRPA